MLRIKVNRNSSTADYVAVPGRSMRFVLPGRYLFAVSLIFAASALFVLPKAEFSTLLPADSDYRLPLNDDSRAYLLSEESQADVQAVADSSLENYEDYDIPTSQFKTQLPSKSTVFSSLFNGFNRQLAPAELEEIKQSAQALRQSASSPKISGTASAKLGSAANAGAAAPTDPVLQTEQTAAAPEKTTVKPAAKRPQGDWYQFTVRPGDSLSAIFARLALPAASLNKISDASEARDLALRPGQIIHFLIDKDNVLKELVLPLGSGEQVRFTRLQASEGFSSFHEPESSHLSDPTAATTMAQAETMPSAVSAAKKRQAQEEARLMAAKAEAERKALANVNPQRPRLILGTLQPGESFKIFAHRIGLTPTEVQNIERMHSANGKLSNLKAGDKLRVLFNAVGTSALINAVEIERAGAPKIAYYRNTADRNFYEENKYVPTAGIFRRFPLATAIKVNSKFNLNRRHPVTHRIAPHKGIDIKAPVGTPVYAPADGVVTFAGYQRAAGYYVIVRHEQNYSTVYMHLSKIDVKKGQQVFVGQIIAKTGNTGRTTGPHLHYEIRINDRPVDPLKIELPSASRPNLAHEQREAFRSNVQVFKHELYNEALARK